MWCLGPSYPHRALGSECTELRLPTAATLPALEPTRCREWDPDSTRGSWPCVTKAREMGDTSSSGGNLPTRPAAVWGLGAARTSAGALWGHSPWPRRIPSTLCSACVAAESAVVLVTTVAARWRCRLTDHRPRLPRVRPHSVPGLPVQCPGFPAQCPGFPAQCPGFARATSRVRPPNVPGHLTQCPGFARGFLGLPTPCLWFARSASLVFLPSVPGSPAPRPGSTHV